MDEVDEFTNPGISEGAAGFDGVGVDTEAPPDTVSPPPVDAPPAASAPPPQPMPHAQPQTPPPGPSVPYYGGGWATWGVALDAGAGIFVGYVAAKDPKDRARNMAICGIASAVGGSLGLGLACWWLASQRGR